MKWPWVSRVAAANGAMVAAADVRAAWVADRDALRAEQAGMVTQIAMLEQDKAALKETHEKLRALCNAFEKKQRDLDHPPISAEELQALLRRHAFVQSKCEALERHNAELEKQLHPPEPGTQLEVVR